MEELGLYNPGNNCPTCLKWNLYRKFDSFDKGNAKGKIAKEAGFELEKLNLDLIGKKLREEEDKKNIKDNRKGKN